MSNRTLIARDHWAVSVSRNGEEIVCIESNCLSGRDISPEDEGTIRNAAHHLLAFIGDPYPVAPEPKVSRPPKFFVDMTGIVE